MELHHAPILKNTQLFSGVSLFRPNSSFASRFGRNPSRNVSFCPFFYPKTHFPFSNGRNLRIYAHFGRPSKRRNSLRKRLTEEKVVRHDPDSLNPGSNFQNPIYTSDEIERCESNLYSGSLEESSSNSVEKSKDLHDSVMWGKLENWVDQYKKDAEFWGIGSGPIFTIFQDLDGNVERVSVNEDEILRRKNVDLGSFRQKELREDFMDVNLKISHAKCLAKEIETGEYKLPNNSSIANFVVSGKQSGFVKGLRSVTLSPDVFRKFSRIGFAMLCGCFIFWSMKRILTMGNDVVELSKEEKEMLRRKMRSRMEKEKIEKGSVEVLGDVFEPLMGSTERPRLDKQQLMNRILKAKASGDKLTRSVSSSSQDAKSRDFDDKIQEIKEMARQVREIELQESSPPDHDGEEYDDTNEMEAADMREELGVRSLNNLSDEDLKKIVGINATNAPSIDTGSVLEASSSVDAIVHNDSRDPNGTFSMEVLVNGQNSMMDPNKSESGNASRLADTNEETQPCDSPNDESYASNKSSFGMKPRVILSVKEAREYLSQKHDKRKLDQEHTVGSLRGADVPDHATDKKLSGEASQIMHKEKKVHESSILDETSNIKPMMDICDNYTLKKTGSISVKTVDPRDVNSTTIKHHPKYLDPKFMEKEYEMGNLQMPRTSQEYTDIDSSDAGPPIAKESWMEKNFHEFEPIIKEIGAGFRDNYINAKGNVQEELNLSPEITQPGTDEDDSELEWMKDDSLREIVFQVRENELLGRDPFHMMDAEDKQAFFKGLERIVEKENAKLVNLHEWVHSRVENVDYGADGISLYDPPEKILPRWKGPPMDKDPEFLNNFVQQRKALLAENMGISPTVNQDAQDSLEKPVESPASDDMSTSFAVHNLRKKSQNGTSTNPKTVIESSDGSARAGKKSGKEYWQHTKKWSREFLEAYNAETDPEVKSIMKDMGKDLDRWITEKEVQEAADVMTKMPKRERRYIEKKLDKLKREMEMFGPQAVVSKYREYAEEKEEDYLWWLDLPFVLCIELYTSEDDVQRVGFYSLEMAEDLDLDPKQYHVIAFEDPGDSKNFCYIIQAHMEMIGNGSAFVVARPPKDAFRESKANGFSVTVIRKGELQLNVDQTLEEVEEQITEIGSKMYHDKIMRERSVDMGSLMKGVLSTSKPTKRSKRMLKKPTKH